MVQVEQIWAYPHVFSDDEDFDEDLLLHNVTLIIHYKIIEL